MYLISLKSHLKEKKIEPSVCSRFAFPGFDFVRLPNLSVQFSYSQTLMIRQNASLTKRNNATHPTSKKKGEGKKKTGAELHCLETPRCISGGESGVELHCVCLQGPLKQKPEADGVPGALEWDWAHLMVSQPGATD